LIFLSIIIPVYNNPEVLKNNLPYLVNYFSKKEFGYEVIIVDDGSFNGEEIENICAQNKCKVIRNENNCGKGNAVKTGMLASEGQFRIFTDADIPYGTEDMESMINNLHNEKFDMVIGDRTLNASSYFKNISFLRSFGSRFFSLIIGGITPGKFGDTQCGLKGFTSEAAIELFSNTKINGFAIDVELIFLAFKRNMKINKIPVSLRKQGVSTVMVFKHGILMLIDLIKIKYYQLTKKYE
jgi:dolichyl-phosphate beta-glucosyltransferase